MPVQMVAKQHTKMPINEKKSSREWSPPSSKTKRQVIGWNAFVCHLRPQLFIWSDLCCKSVSLTVHRMKTGTGFKIDSFTTTEPFFFKSFESFLFALINAFRSFR